MSVDVVVEVTIAKARRRVAEVMFDPTLDPIWTTGVVEVNPKQQGRLRRGGQVERVSKFLGRRMHYLIDVVDADDDSFVAMRTDNPFEMRIRYELEDCAMENETTGTLVRIRCAGEAGGFRGGSG